MKIHTFLIIFIFILCNGYGQTPANDSHWQLLWQDDFNDSVVNSNVWDVKNNFDHWGDPLVFTSNNVFTSNGNLAIRLKHENYSCPAGALNQWDCERQYTTGLTYDYTSGWVETQLPYSIQYGFIEVRLKLPYINGIWPALWTFSGDSGYQEIDIFEMLPGMEEYCHRNKNEKFTHDNYTATTNIHLESPCFLCGGHNCDDNPLCNCDDPYAFPAVMHIQDYTQWHTYGLEWSPSRIIWYIDNYPVRYYKNFHINAPTTLIMDLSIQTNPLADNSSLPGDMLIDYVKVYALNKDCDNFINTTNYDFSTYDNMEKNFIKIGGGGANNTLSVGKDITMRASQYIEVSGDFYVPVGTSLYLDVNKDCSIDLGSECTLFFNPCTYDFSSYDNSVKKIIELGGNSCSMTITPTNNDIVLQATDEIHIKPGVVIRPSPGHLVSLKITPCPY